MTRRSKWISWPKAFTRCLPMATALVLSLSEPAAGQNFEEAPEEPEEPIFSAVAGIGFASQLSIPGDAGPRLLGSAVLAGINWRLDSGVRLGPFYAGEMAIAQSGIAATHSPLFVVDVPVSKRRCARRGCSAFVQLGLGWSFQFGTDDPSSDDSFSGSGSGPAALLAAGTEWPMGKRMDRKIGIGPQLLFVPYHLGGSGGSITARFSAWTRF